MRINHSSSLLYRPVAKAMLLLAAASMVIGVSGCSAKSADSGDNSHIFVTEGLSAQYTDQLAETDGSLDPQYADYADHTLALSEKAYTDFTNYVDQMETVYTYSELYGVDAAMQRYEAAQEPVTAHTSQLPSLSADALYASVKENNRAYLQQKEQEYTSGFFDEFSDDELKEICEIIMGEVKFYESKLPDMAETSCVLGNLKIFSKATMTNAYVTDDDCLILCPDMIKTLTIRSTSEDQDVYKDTLCHETIHILQKSCQDELTSYYRIGSSYRFEELEVNPLFCNWFYEGCAELLATHYTGDDPLVYQYYINYIESMSLATLLGENENAARIEEASLSRTYAPLFDAFGCKTAEDEKEVINLLFSLDIVERDNEDFLSLVGLDPDSDQYISVKRNIKASVCETLSKTFYRNLAGLVKNHPATLEEVFYLITVFENDLDYHLNYSSEEKYEDNQGFLTVYRDLQTRFFGCLASGTVYSQEEIEEIFDHYSIRNASTEDADWLAYLTPEKKALIEEIRQRLLYEPTEQVMDVCAKMASAE